jgi:hypothetical protein
MIKWYFTKRKKHDFQIKNKKHEYRKEGRKINDLFFKLKTLISMQSKVNFNEAKKKV